VPNVRRNRAGDTRALPSGAGSAAIAVVVRPWLWFTALRQLARIARPGWWRHAPFVPLPDPEYVRFRLETAYGPNGRLRGPDVVSYLEWCRHAD
jgi:hypothetical protein